MLIGYYVMMNVLIDDVFVIRKKSGKTLIRAHFHKNCF